MAKKLSLVVPCYNEEQALPYFYESVFSVEKQLDNIEFEIIFIDDGSKDNTLQVLRGYTKNDSKIKYISFSRNFGKEAAIFAGAKASTGEYVVFMDADLQHPPEMLSAMVDILENEDYDIVAARRTNRKGEPIIRSFFSKLFYKIINKISNAEFVDGASDFRMMKRNVVDAIISMGEYNRFSKGIFGWVGFRTKWIPYENVERVAGETKWSFWKLLLYSFEGIVAFSTAPLAIASIAGIILFFLALLMVIYIIIKTLLFGDPVGGWPSLACMVMFMGGGQLLCMGILGQYLAKTYLETKRRPIYIVKETEKDGK